MGVPLARPCTQTGSPRCGDVIARRLAGDSVVKRRVQTETNEKSTKLKLEKQC